MSALSLGPDATGHLNEDPPFAAAIHPEDLLVHLAPPDDELAFARLQRGDFIQRDAEFPAVVTGETPDEDE
jgi:hypothetical protein